MRLIDADAYKALHCKKCPSDCGVCSLVYGKDDMCGLIDQAPTIDAVPVVRCKDCKWFADNNGGEWYGCQMYQVIRITPEDAPKPDDFCSYGERREGGNGDEAD